jgi:hypothetical protein
LLKQQNQKSGKDYGKKKTELILSDSDSDTHLDAEIDISQLISEVREGYNTTIKADLSLASLPTLTNFTQAFDNNNRRNSIKSN